MTVKKVIRLLIVDDSFTAREALCGIFSKSQDIVVTGTACNGNEAVEMARKLQPDIITMDIQMPGMNGYQCTEEILSILPIPIVIVSTFYNNYDTVFRAMEVGAVAAVEKPGFIKDPAFSRKAAQLIATVRNMSEVKVIRHNKNRFLPPGKNRETIKTTAVPQIAAIGISTGGPPLLAKILEHLPADLPFPLCIIQHIASGFTESLAEWLQEYSKMPVSIIKTGDKALPGNVYIASGGQITNFIQKDVFVVNPTREPEQPAPSVNVFFDSMNKFYSSACIAILMTGMGRDGAMALKRLRDANAQTIIQDKASSAIYGMPGEALKLNAAKYIMTPEEIVTYLSSFANWAR